VASGGERWARREDADMEDEGRRKTVCEGMPTEPDGDAGDAGREERRPNRAVEDCVVGRWG